MLALLSSYIPSFCEFTNINIFMVCLKSTCSIHNYSVLFHPDINFRGSSMAGCYLSSRSV